MYISRKFKITVYGTADSNTFPCGIVFETLYFFLPAMSDEKIDPAALSPEMLAKLLSSAAKRRITEEQVKEIAEEGNLLSLDGTISIVRYTAFLASEKYRNDH